MRNDDCVQFLQWALPRLNMRWSGYRKVRKQVCKRVGKRLAELGMDDIEAYRRHLQDDQEEWAHLDSLCRITISRFYRDKAVFEVLARYVLPSLARNARNRGDTVLRAWCAGCASGEEPYTLSLAWSLDDEDRFPDLEIQIVATDADATMIRRAREGCYGSGSLKDLPQRWRDRAFATRGDAWCLLPEYRQGVEYSRQDIRFEQPDGSFDLVLCRNLVFTYFDDKLQVEVLKRISHAMHDGAALVTGIHECLPKDSGPFATWFGKERVYRYSRRVTTDMAG